MTLALPETISSKRQPPDPEGTAAFMSRIGYSLEEALSDIIDNSIDAEAHSVLVRFIRGDDRVQQIVVADNGKGMSPAELHAAMQYGVRQKHARGDLGKYGIGLKAAAFSQCKSLSVLSMKAGKCAGRRWTLESIKDDWRLGELDPDQVRTVLSQDWMPVALKQKGTLVILDQLDSLQSSMSDFNKSLQKTINRLRIDLGLRFHRFIMKGRVSITLDTAAGIDEESDSPVEVTPLDPFGYKKSGRTGYPITFQLQISNAEVKADAHIWPAKSKDENYKLGSGKVAERQGFYFYRNDRLIKAGGWHQLQSDSEPHSSLARVLVEMPPELDSTFRLTVQKNDFNVPPEFIDAVRASKAGNTPFSDYLRSAQEVYRNAPEEEGIRAYPAGGIPKPLSTRLQKILYRNQSSGGKVEIDFRWKRLPADRVFLVDPGNQQVTLNSLYRDAVTGGNNSGADAPVFKTLLFFGLRELLEAGRISKKIREQSEVLNSMLREAIKCQA